MCPSQKILLQEALFLDKEWKRLSPPFPSSSYFFLLMSGKPDRPLWAPSFCDQAISSSHRFHVSLAFPGVSKTPPPQKNHIFEQII